MKALACRCMQVSVNGSNVERSALAVGEPDKRAFPGSSGAIRVGESTVPVYGAAPGSMLECALLALIAVDETSGDWSNRNLHPALLAASGKPESLTALVLVTSEIDDICPDDLHYDMDSFEPDGNSYGLVVSENHAFLGVGDDLALEIGPNSFRVDYTNDRINFEKVEDED